MRSIFLTLMLCAVTLAAGCSKRDSSADGTVLARVADRTVTDRDVENTLDKMFGDAAALADAGASEKAMESLVSLHAIAAAQEKTMGKTDLGELERKVFHYREELLMQAYVREHSQDLSVSEAEVKAYYDKHPELFGATEVRRFETLAAGSSGSGDAAQALQAATADANWKALAAASQGRLVYAAAATDGPSLNARIASTVRTLKAGQASDVLFVDGAMLRIRLTEVLRLPAKPLAEVRSDVRRTVAARKTRDRIRELAESVRKETKIKYTKAAQE